jgi:hypothetical protein
MESPGRGIARRPQGHVALTRDMLDGCIDVALALKLCHTTSAICEYLADMSVFVG